METSNQVLIKQIVDEVQESPEDLIREVLDFIGYLQIKYETQNREDRKATLLATFGS